MKDEIKDIAITEVSGLQYKMYPLMKDDKKGDKKEKAINEDVVEKNLEEYIGRLFEKKKQGSKRKKIQSKS